MVPIKGWAGVCKQRASYLWSVNREGLVWGLYAGGSGPIVFIKGWSGVCKERVAGLESVNSGHLIWGL